MKQKVPITAESFTQNWRIVDTQRRIARKKYTAARIATFFSNMVFTLLAVVVSNGLIHDLLPGSYGRFLAQVPCLLPLWEKICSLLMKPDDSVALQIAVVIIGVYAVCFAVCAFFVLLVTALYHPFSQDLPSGTRKENAEHLLAMARDARRCSIRTKIGGSMFWALIFMMVQFALLSLYWLIELKSFDQIFLVTITPVMELLAPHITSFNDMQRAGLESALFMPTLMILLMGIFLIYAFANQVHTRSVRFLFRYHIPYSFVADVEYYYTFVDDSTEGITEEEITAIRKQNAEKLRAEALDLERICAYAKAKELLAAAAHGGDCAAMEHYARHWLVGGAKDPGRYWLQKCVDTGEASEYATKTLRRLKWHLKIQAKYLK